MVFLHLSFITVIHAAHMLTTDTNIQDGARNVIPLIVHVTNSYYYKNI